MFEYDGGWPCGWRRAGTPFYGALYFSAQVHNDLGEEDLNRARRRKRLPAQFQHNPSQGVLNSLRLSAG